MFFFTLVAFNLASSLRSRADAPSYFKMWNLCKAWCAARPATCVPSTSTKSSLPLLYLLGLLSHSLKIFYGLVSNVTARKKPTAFYIEYTGSHPMLSPVSTWMGDHLGRNTSVGVLSCCLVIVHRPLIYIWVMSFRAERTPNAQVGSAETIH